MILFFDTSALMKLFVQELHSDTLRNTARSSPLTIVSQLTWVEMCAALAFKQRTHQIDAPEAARARKELDEEWGRYTHIAVDNTIIANAGELAQTFGLRAYDSLQLASAKRVYSQAGPTLVFCCFDKQLNAAASTLGIQTIHLQNPSPA